MKRRSFPVLLLCLLSLFYAGCDGAGDDGGTVRLTGQVVDDADAPVAGAIVRVPASSITTSEEDVVALTDSSGTYTLSVDIEASTNLQVIVSKDGVTQQTTVTVVAGQAREVPVLVLAMSGTGGGTGATPTKTATLTGQVVDGTGVSAADVVVRALSGTSEPVRTDADGHFTLVVGTDVDGEVTIEARLDGYTARRTVTMLVDQTVEVALLVLPYPEVVGNVTLSGRVVDDAGTSVAGALVEVPGTAYTTSDQPATTQTDASGNYELVVGLRTGGDLTVVASKDGFRGERIVTAFPNETRSVPTLVLATPVDGDGTVTLTGEVVDEDGAPVADARVTVPATAATVSSADATTRTDADGRYSLTLGIYADTDLQVIADKDGLTAETTVTAFSGSSRAVPTLVLPMGTATFATLTGRVVDGTGAAAANAIVTARDFDTQARTGTDGRFTLRLEMNADAEVVVEASKDGYSTSRAVTALANEAVEVDVLVLPYPEAVGTVKLTGRVVDENAEVVAGALVEVLPNERTVSDAPVSTQTGSDGSYSLEVSLRTGGDLTVVASKDGFRGEHTLTAFPGMPRTVPTLVLSVSGGESGTVVLKGGVVDRDGVPVRDARVSVAPTGQTTSTTPVTTRTGAYGNYSLTLGIRTGTDLTVKADRDGYSAKATVTVFAGDERVVSTLVLPYSTSDQGSYATLEGRVVNRNGEPVAGARVQVPADQLVTVEDAVARTEADGTYSLTVVIDASRELTVTAAKDGFEISDTVTIFPGDTREVPTLVLPFPDDAAPEPGRPSNILLQSVNRTSIGIIGSGASEVARLTYLVTDSTGTPVALNEGAFVRFSLGQQPGGGEFIAPQQAETNSEGVVTVNLSSGTRAGTVQIIAEADVDGRTIRSNPVSVAIHGGMPDLEHFSIGPDKFNFPGLRRYGKTNEISVIVGDRYSNPVKEGTSVYFETSHGVIEGSAFTDAHGRGSVTLSSANPLPPDGIAVVTASTANEDEERIEVKAPVVFSGVPIVVVSPATASLYQTYHVTLADPNGNPLTPGTSMQVRAGGTKVKATGNVDVRLDDTAFHDGNGDGDLLDYDDVIRGPGVTKFTFRTVDDLEIDESGQPVLETVSILVDGPNGSLEIVLTPEGAQAGQNATMVQSVDDAAVFELDEEVSTGSW